MDSRLKLVAEFIIGNLDEDGYLTVTDEELIQALRQFPESPLVASQELDDEAALELVRRGVELVQHLDPPGVAARDLRECLMIQIAAQQQEFGQVFARHSEDGSEDPHGSFRVEAEAKLDERRHCMEVAAMIADRHLHLVQKRDVKDLARALQVSPAEAHSQSSSFAPWNRGRDGSTTVSRRA